MGSPSYCVPVLKALLSLPCQLVGAYTQTGKPSGRGRRYEPSPVKGFALERGLEVFQPLSLRHPAAQRELASLRPDVIVVAAYGKLLPREVLEIPPHGCVNVHPSLLPKYRGPSPVATAILEGEVYTGTTLILLDEGMDTGPILSSRVLRIEAGIATSESLTPLLFQLGGELVKETLPLWVKGRVTPQPQDHSRASVTRKLEKSDGEARWELTAEELERRLRSCTPWPGLFTYWSGKLLKILSAVPTQLGDSIREPSLGAGASDMFAQTREPGVVVSLKEPGVALGVVTGQGVLGLRTLQLEGRRPVSSEEFLRGYGQFPGSKLPN